MTTSDTEKIKIYYNYVDCPKQVRIISEALCLDHIFQPACTNKPMNYGQCIDLLKNTWIDEVYFEAQKGDAWYYSPFNNNGKMFLEGWENADLFTHEDTPYKLDIKRRDNNQDLKDNRMDVFCIYVDCPLQVRVVSKSLCLDHIFYPYASGKIMNYCDCAKLLENEYIDSVFINISKGDVWYFEQFANNERIVLQGWRDVSEFTFIEVLNYDPPKS